MRTTLACLLIAAAGVAAAGEPPPASEPLCPDCNIVLISIDTLRADHLPCYGYHRDTAPFLCELAAGAGGVLFEKASNPGGGTLPSHMSLMTSLYPAVHGMTAETSDHRLEDAFVTLAEVLADAGYARAAFTDGGFTQAAYGFDQGFEVYDHSGRGLLTSLHRATRWLAEGPGERPFFLFLHTYDVHSERKGKALPYDSRRPYRTLYAEHQDEKAGCGLGACGTQFLKEVNAAIRRGADPHELISDEQLQWLIDLYDGAIRGVDDTLRQFVAQLRRRQLLERTILVILSDHGEEFLDHGMLLHTDTQYQELTGIPLILRLPGLGDEGRRLGQLASMVDVMPTLAELVGADVGDHAQGASLVPAITAGRSVRSEALLTTSITTGRWKLFPTRNELYDRDADPTDRANLFADHTEVVEELEARHAEIEQRCARLRETILGQGETGDDGESILDEKLAEELRALGYVVP